MTEPIVRPGDEQSLVGFMANDEWDALLGEVNGLIERMEDLPAGDTKTDVFRLLDGIDAIHREALRRLVRLFKEGVIEKVVTDPAIHTLMELYDLLPAADETSVDAMHSEEPRPKGRFPTIPIRAVSSAPSPPVRYPHWLPVFDHFSDLAPAAPQEVLAENEAILLCRRGDELFAMESRCSRDGTTLRGATLNGYTLTCPAHSGCHYDVRQGSPLGGGDNVPCYPVRTEENGRVLVGLDMDFNPHLPAL